MWWAYLATVIDLHSRAHLGWAIADHLRTWMVTDALEMAITKSPTSTGRDIPLRPRGPRRVQVVVAIPRERGV